MTQGLVALFSFISIGLTNPGFISPLPETVVEEQKIEVLAEKEMDLTDRYEESQFVNEVFRDNIILSLHYLDGREKNKQVDWDEIRKPFTVSFILQPGEVFAFHDQVLDEYKDKVVKTMNSKFYADEGYKNSGYIYGDGVCHLASLINWASSEAGLVVEAPANHNFRLIPDIPKEFGVSIRYADYGLNTQRQNLYVVNNLDNNVNFSFEVSETKVKVIIWTILE